MAILALLAILLGLPVMSPASDGSTTSAGKPAARATLSLVRLSPLTVTGRAFKAKERVRITADGRRKWVIAGDRGGFTIKFPAANACNGVVIVAVGSEGSRTSLSYAQFSNVHCLEPAVSLSSTMAPARSPAD